MSGKEAYIYHHDDYDLEVVLLMAITCEGNLVHELSYLYSRF